jgi:ribose/xylose/arabinose/galactoside ABC-type transport system permease subunit
MAAHSRANVCTICTIDRIRKCFKNVADMKHKGPAKAAWPAVPSHGGVAQLTAFGATPPPSAASGYELWVITAILLGGTSLSGGQGSVFRTALGLLIIGVLNNGMVLLSVPTFYQTIANGSLLLMAVIVDQLQKRPGRMAAES